MERASSAKARERIRAKGASGFGLRATVAAGLQTKITNSGPRQGVRIRVDTTRLGHGGGSLPALLDGQRPWRHPVFGHRDVWVQQTPSPTGWFTRPTRAATPTVRAAVLKAMNDTNDKL